MSRKRRGEDGRGGNRRGGEGRGPEGLEGRRRYRRGGSPGQAAGSACPGGLARVWCRDLNAALLWSRVEVPARARERVLLPNMNQEPSCFLAHDSFTHLAIVRHWHPQPGLANWHGWGWGVGAWSREKRVVVN